MYLTGQLTILSFLIALCAFILYPKPNTYNERLFLWFALIMTAIRSLYSISCVFRERAIVWYNTDVFGGITAISFLVLLLHISFDQPNKK